MRVIRISAREAYDAAANQHRDLIDLHVDHLAEIEEHNDKIRQTHKEAVTEREKIDKMNHQAADEIHSLMLAEHSARKAQWEQYQEEQAQPSKAKKIKNALLGGMKGKPVTDPGDPPERPWVPELPEVPDPIFIEGPKTPEFRHPEPETYKAEKVEGDDYVEIDGVHGKAIAAPGCYILTANSDGHKIIVHPDDFERFYEEI